MPQKQAHRELSWGLGQMKKQRGHSLRHHETNELLHLTKKHL